MTELFDRVPADVMVLVCAGIVFVFALVVLRAMRDGTNRHLPALESAIEKLNQQARDRQEPLSPAAE
jgi:hypothetical protein